MFSLSEIRALAEQRNLPFEVLCARLRLGWDIYLALVLPAEISEKSIKFAFVSLRGNAYYKVSWSKDPVSACEIIEHYVPQELPLYDLIFDTGEYTPYSAFEGDDLDV